MGVETPSCNTTIQPGPKLTRALDSILSNEDLLDAIFEFVQEEAPSSNSTSPQTFSCKQQLLHLALTHKGFRDSALKALWRTIPGLLPLFKLIPEFQYIDGVYMFTSTFDVATISVYAKNVKHISFTVMRQNEIISPHAYQMWPAVSGRTNIPLPALRSVRINQCYHPASDLAGALFIVSTVPPCLLSMEIVDVYPDSSAFLRQLHTTSCIRHHEVLQELTVEGVLSREVLRAVIGRLDSTKVSRLEIHTYGPDDTLFNHFNFDALSRLSNLTHLSLNAPDVSESNEQAHIGSGFRTLRTLHFQCTPKHAARGLCWIAFPPNLSTVEIEACNPYFTSEDTSLKLVLELLLASPTISSIQIKQIRGPGLHVIIPPDFGLSKTPTDLQHLSLHIDRISNAPILIAHLANFCPRLVSLTLPDTVSDDSDPTESKDPDLTSLTVLAKGCPNLLDLRICLRLHRVTQQHYAEFIGSGVGSISSSHPLRSLRISDAGGDQQFDITEYISMARFIHRLFPRLEQLEANRDVVGGWSGTRETCKVLQELILVMREVKEEAVASIGAVKTIEDIPSSSSK